MTRSTTIRTARVATGLATAALVAAAAFATGAPAGADTTTAPTTTSVDPNDALLRARAMPEVNEVQDWARVAARRGRVSAAQPGSLKTLGAADTARRDFALPGASATNLVLTFDDVASAGRAYREIKTWRWHTGDNVPESGEVLYTSGQTRVDVERGRGTYFSFVFKADRASDEGTFEWLGITRRGADVSLVAWRVDGQDATYEVDPTIASVQAANEQLARLG
jgi:hypothetical protein